MADCQEESRTKIHRLISRPLDLIPSGLNVGLFASAFNLKLHTFPASGDMLCRPEAALPFIQIFFSIASLKKNILGMTLILSGGSIIIHTKIGGLDAR
jgi:hypothetical protein